MFVTKQQDKNVKCGTIERYRKNKKKKASRCTNKCIHLVAICCSIVIAFNPEGYAQCSCLQSILKMIRFYFPYNITIFEWQRATEAK